ncbi:MAG: hypothetical protein F4W93_11200 [Dehalococcoidia bacterium]|nr:hypothetical protein [Dehalococcoidia bacterium]
MPETTEVGTTKNQGKEVNMFKAVIKFIKPAGPGADFERYLQKLQELDATGAPTREQAKRDFRDLRSADPYGFYTRN